MNGVVTLHRGEYMNGVVHPWKKICNYTFCMENHTSVSDIFLVSETKCLIFLDIVSGRDIFSQLGNFLTLKFFNFKFF